MFKAEPLQKKANYYRIIEGSFRLPTDKEDPEKIVRSYVNPKTNEEGVAYERGYKALYGTITNVSFPESLLKDGTKLRNLHINLGEDENGVAQIISIPSDSRFATDFLKRLPVIDFTREVRLMPYDFEKDGPRQVGISVYYKNPETEEYTERVENDFFTKVEEKDGQKVYTNLHGFPEPTEDDSSDWPFYFKKVNKFLIKYAQEHVLPKFADMAYVKKNEVARIPKSKEEEERISPEDVPF